MDAKSIDEMIRLREKNYIWQEKELKRNLAVSTGGILLFFLVIYAHFFPGPYWACCLAAALFINGIWCFILYREKYRNYLSIIRYLEEFEAGNYEFRMENGCMRTGIYSQITEQMERMGLAFLTLKTRLVEEKEKTKEIVTDISHQLKTPAAALKLSYELLQDESLTEQEKQEFLERGMKEAHKLGHFIEALTNVSRLEADMIKLNPKKADLKETLLGAVNGVYMKAGEKDIEIEMHEFDDMMVYHDPRWTAEAILNVLDNAVKYSPEKTKIKIRAKRFVSYVLIEVEDEGIGIPKKDYPNIFKRFYRGGSREVEQSEGAGVGLYLVRQILEGQGGSVCVDSARKKGTVIRMMLPADYICR